MKYKIVALNKSKRKSVRKQNRLTAFIAYKLLKWSGKYTSVKVWRYGIKVSF